MPPIPTGIRALAALFLLGACLSALACIALLLPGGVLEPIWKLNPESHEILVSLGHAGIWLMAAASVACVFSAYGLRSFSDWGHALALSVLAINLVVDVGMAIFRHDIRAMIAVPIGGLFIAYLLQPPIIALFKWRPLPPGHTG